MKLIFILFVIPFISSAPPITSDQSVKTQLFILDNIYGSQFNDIPILDIPNVGTSWPTIYSLVDFYSDISKTKFQLLYFYEGSDTPPKEWKEICKIYKNEIILPTNYKLEYCTWIFLELPAFLLNFKVT